MPLRSLDSLAHALGAAADLPAAVVALGEALTELDPIASLAVLRHDGKSGLLVESVVPRGPRTERSEMQLAVAHFPRPLAFKIATGGEFADAADQSEDYARLVGFRPLPGGGSLSLKGVRVDGQLAAVVAIYEQRRMFGTRTVEALRPAVALFELAFARLIEREGRDEATRTLEEVTQRLHAQHLAQLASLEAQLERAKSTPSAPRPSVADERELARIGEELRRAQHRMRALEEQVIAGTAQLEHAHVELHRRNELLRQRSRTLYLLERVLSLASATDDPKLLADGLLSLVGDDLQAQRCSLMLAAPEPEMLYLAAARGLAPHVKMGHRIRIGEGVAGRVAASREPALVVDAADASAQPLLGDDYLSTGSFISFPLVLHDRVIGVVNLTNRIQRGLFVEEDVERVRLLGLVCAIAAREAALSERLFAVVTRGS